MNQLYVKAHLLLPLYRVLHRELTVEEFESVFPTEKDESVIEIDYAGSIRAVGVHAGSLHSPMRIIMTFCDYLEQNGNRGCFVALEPEFVKQLEELFPGRFARVAREFVQPFG